MSRDLYKANLEGSGGLVASTALKSWGRARWEVTFCSTDQFYEIQTAAGNRLPMRCYDTKELYYYDTKALWIIDGSLVVRRLLRRNGQSRRINWGLTDGRF